MLTQPIRSLLSLPLLLGLPLMATAHPHVYIDAGLGLVYDGQGRLTGVEVEWAYDELYSLLIVEDLGLDQDGDGVLPEDERAALQGFDTDWEPGFDGRLYLLVNGQRQELLPPENFDADYRDGRVLSRHLRPLAQPLAGDAALTVQVHDPEFYVDFTIPKEPGISGRDDCDTVLVHGDPAAAPAAYRDAVNAALAEADDPMVNEEVLIVDIGGVGGDEVQVQCGAAE
ncbi:DUF1007 family protein [Paracoccus caeni]|uniref:DUF1007 family protein n=1 Tax=Paracoccus caeni TaxID=657651 RepID=A0A934SGS1_9RHOB|nr:DUF1007 family protein [Paracoccus caeni]MBK4217165.1 DUF1007 family protein [Paracoccus caeni]